MNDLNLNQIEREGDSFNSKVSDFGLSRVVSDNTYYKSESGMIPFKWSSIESCLYGKFTSKSDVWSFGVVLWEICSNGKEPFSGFTNTEVVKKIEKGERLKKPNGCNEDHFKIMNECWKENPQERPSFKDLYQRFELNCDKSNTLNSSKPLNEKDEDNKERYYQ